MSKKFVEQEIGEINKKIGEITNLVNNGNVDEATYNKLRLELNMHVIQALVGGEIVSGKKGNTIKFKHSLPTKTQVSAIATAMGTFVQQVESRFTSIQGTDDSDDMSIPATVVLPLAAPAKNSNKALKEAILGANAAGGGYASTDIGPMDVIAIAGFGEEVRKKENLKKTLIIGGITLAVVGAGIGVGVYCYNKKKHDEDIIDIDDFDEELPDIDEEPPVVDLIEDSFESVPFMA